MNKFDNVISGLVLSLASSGLTAIFAFLVFDGTLTLLEASLSVLSFNLIFTIFTLLWIWVEVPEQEGTE